MGGSGKTKKRRHSGHARRRGSAGKSGAHQVDMRHFRAAGHHHSTYVPYFWYSSNLEGELMSLKQPKDNSHAKYIRSTPYELEACVVFDARLRSVLNTIGDTPGERFERLIATKINIFSEELPEFLTAESIEPSEYAEFIHGINVNSVRTFIEVTFPLEMEMSRLSQCEKVLYFSTGLVPPVTVEADSSGKGAGLYQVAVKQHLYAIQAEDAANITDFNRRLLLATGAAIMASATHEDLVLMQAIMGSAGLGSNGSGGGGSSYAGGGGVTKGSSSSSLVTDPMLPSSRNSSMASMNGGDGNEKGVLVSLFGGLFGRRNSSTISPVVPPPRNTANTSNTAAKKEVNEAAPDVVRQFSAGSDENDEHATDINADQVKAKKMSGVLMPACSPKAGAASNVTRFDPQGISPNSHQSNSAGVNVHSFGAISSPMKEDYSRSSRPDGSENSASGVGSRVGRKRCESREQVQLMIASTELTPEVADIFASVVMAAGNSSFDLVSLLNSMLDQNGGSAEGTVGSGAGVLQLHPSRDMRWIEVPGNWSAYSSTSSQNISPITAPSAMVLQDL